MKTQNIKLDVATLTTYLWEDSDELKVKKRPGVLVIPGGGYEFCSDREAEPVALAYLAQGFNAFVLRYTVKSDFATPFAEANCALKTIAENAEKWHVDRGRLAVCGFSAGAHLAFSLATMGDTRPSAAVLGYPAVIGKDWATHKPFVPDLVSKVDGKTCPTFVFASRDDDVVPINNSLALCSSLDKAGVPFELHIFADGKHGYSLAKFHTSEDEPPRVNPDAAKWFDLSVAWLKKTIGDVEF